VIRAEHLTKIYAGGVVGVDSVSFEVTTGQTLALIGPSGCGKTTTLKMLNRLSEPTSGRIFVNEVDLLEQDPIRVRRGIGYVLQGGGLFPHWSAGQNVGVVPRLLGWDEARIAARVAEMLTLVQLPAEEYRQRFPAEMSGGQRQRVGIARALAADPPIVLWDEPFSALDPLTRRQMQQEFLQLKQLLGKTMVFVTHDMAEAFLLADRVLILRDGRVEQYGSPAEIQASPASDFVREFLELEAPA
jgi:osmoprotectant transport system ATP-binding protein